MSLIRGRTAEVGVGLDWAVWRRLVDYALKQPDLIRKHIDDRRAALQSEADHSESEIERLNKRLGQIVEERLAYSRQNARGVLSDEEYDQLRAEADERYEGLTLEVERLRTLRDETAQVEAWQDYMDQLFEQVQGELDWLDCDHSTLYSLSQDERDVIMKRRRTIVSVT